MNARSIATLGIGFGVLAVATIGLLIPSVEPAESSLRNDGVHFRAITDKARKKIMMEDNEVLELIGIYMMMKE